MTEQEKQQLLYDNINLVHGYLQSKNVEVVGYDYDDLAQELSIQLWDLINKLDRYDTSKTKLSTLAYTYFNNRIKQLLYLQDRDKRKSNTNMVYYDAICALSQKKISVYTYLEQTGELHNYSTEYDICKDLTVKQYLEEIFDDLTDKQRTVMNLYLKDVQQKDIAAHMGISHNAVICHINKVKQKVKELYQDVDLSFLY